MEIVKKINNNVALAHDGSGRELVVFGKGIGFPAMPYTLDDLSKVQKTFYDVSEKYFMLLQEIPEELFLLTGEITENAAEELDCQLNPNLPFILADHLHFAIQRVRAGVKLCNPLAYDVEHLYPQEYALARGALRQVNALIGDTELPQDEIASIAMHFINAETEVGDMHSTMLTAKVISDLTCIVEKFFDIQLDKSSFNFSRFSMHLRYLVQRMMQGPCKAAEPTSIELFRTIRRQCPNSDACVQQMVHYLSATWNWQCNEEEKLYLIMHVHRVKSEHLDRETSDLT